MKKCAFCESLNFKREFEKHCSLPILFTVALVDHLVCGNGRLAGRTTDYNGGDGYKLNFCPECGRRLKGVPE